MVIAQPPNKEIILTTVFLVLCYVTSDVLQTISLILFTFFGVLWSIMEIFSGINWVRKVFGMGGLVGIVLYLSFVLGI